MNLRPPCASLGASYTAAHSRGSMTQAPAFHEKILHFLKREKAYTPQRIQTLYTTYVAFRQQIPDLPDPQQADIRDIIAFEYRASKDPNEAWETFRDRMHERYELETRSTNYNFPLWTIKTDERPNAWIAHTARIPYGTPGASIDQALQRAVDRLCAAYAVAYTNSSIPDACVNPYYRRQIATFIVRNAAMFFSEIGKQGDVTFRWGPAIVSLAGLGNALFTDVAKELETNDGWDFARALCEKDPAKFMDLVRDARQCCGYPLAIWRIDAPAAIRSLRTVTDTIPSWISQLIALHIAKYCRVILDYSADKHAIFVAYQNDFAIIPYSKEHHYQPISNPGTKQLTSLLKNILKLPSTTGKNRGPWDDAVDVALARINLSTIPTREPVGCDPTYVVPSGVKISVSTKLSIEESWIKSHIIIKNCARIDLETGRIDKNAIIESEDVYAYQWPTESITDEEFQNWLFNIPDRVEPRLPSEIITSVQKNLNFLGVKKGFCALFDAVIIAALLRTQLSGCAVGAALQKEYPLVFVYPTGGTREETTNQGKTNFCRLAARILVPHLPGEMSVNRSDSAPVQRSLAWPITKYGTAIYDEYLMPYSRTHILGKDSLQSLATGSSIAPGEAGGNSPGIRLQYPLFFTAKVATTTPDIQNRQLAVFLDKITEETRLTDQELADISSGRVSMVARLSALLYIKKHAILEHLRKLTPLSGEGYWRFGGHMAIAAFLAGQDIACITEYLRRSTEQCVSQLSKADESGLVDELGVNAQFNIEYFWDNAKETTLESLLLNFIMAEKTNGGLSVVETVKTLVEDGTTRRNFEAVLKQYSIREQTAVAKTVERLRQGPLVRGEWKLSLSKSERSKRFVCRIEKEHSPLQNSAVKTSKAPTHA